MDSNFFTHADDNTMGTWTGFDGYRKKDAGAQVEHLLLHLKAAQERLGLRVIDYQVVFQPAMFMFDKYAPLLIFIYVLTICAAEQGCTIAMRRAC